VTAQAVRGSKHRDPVGWIQGESARPCFKSESPVTNMSKPQDRIVTKRPDGTWANQRNNADRASSIHDTQRAAIDAARDNLRNQGGGEVTIQGRDGHFRAKDTIAPGRDPSNIRG